MSLPHFDQQGFRLEEMARRPGAPTAAQLEWMGHDPAPAVQRAQQQQAQLLGGIVQLALREPGGALQIKDERGAIVATLQAHGLPTRPRDMPRHLRPKGKLSKRERVAARRSKGI